MIQVTPNFKVARIRCERHLQWIRTLPCCVCGRVGWTISHHLTIAEPKARGLRAGDDKAVPVCVPQHDAQYRDSIHNMGDERAWWLVRGLDPLEIAAALWARSVAAGRAGRMAA